jgi:perosamine synthetase
MVTVVVDEAISFSRDLLLQDFKNKNIDGRVFFWPLSLIREGDCQFIKTGENPVSYSIYNRAFNLPCYHDIREDDVERVVDCVKPFLRT